MRTASTVCVLLGFALATVAYAAPADKKGIQIIGAGFGRTGTSSLQVALQSIGYKTYHMKENLRDNHNQVWYDAFLKGKVDDMIDFVVDKGYTATLDFPISVFYQELMARYPEAKVVLTVRDSPEAWVKSVCSTIGVIDHVMARKPFAFLERFRLFTGFVMPMWLRALWRVDEDGPLPTGEGPICNLVGREHMARAYTRWLAEVKANVPAEKLLVLNAKDGWQPLCDFLGLDGGDCPGGKLPHINEGAELQRAIALFNFIADWWMWLGVLLLVLVVLGLRALLRCCSRRGDATATASRKTSKKD